MCDARGLPGGQRLELQSPGEGAVQRVRRSTALAAAEDSRRHRVDRLLGSVVAPLTTRYTGDAPVGEQLVDVVF